MTDTSGEGVGGHRSQRGENLVDLVLDDRVTGAGTTHSSAISLARTHTVDVDRPAHVGDSYAREPGAFSHRCPVLAAQTTAHRPRRRHVVVIGLPTLNLDTS
jgi:hypothetical protein